MFLIPCALPLPADSSPSERPPEAHDARCQGTGNCHLYSTHISLLPS